VVQSVERRRSSGRQEQDSKAYVVVSYGGGTDSTALLIEAHRRKIRPDLILFADTGSEMPHTYDYLRVIAEWCARVGFPEIQVVRWYHGRDGFVPLHQRCLERAELPSKAYGRGSCSTNWKQGPLNKAATGHPAVVAALEAGEVVERWIGYDAREGARVANLHHKPPPFRWRAPLHEWDIDREQCREIIAAAGLPQPGKSSCWMCPMMRGDEVDAMAREYPALAALAVQMERNAWGNEHRGIGEHGLGLRLGARWEEWLSRPKQAVLFPAADEPDDDMPCGCHD